METHFIPPQWLENLAWASLCAAFVSAAIIVYDIFGRGNRQKMKIMEAVYPITALYWGPVMLWRYFTKAARGSDEMHSDEGSEDLRPWQIEKAVSHCGAGCTVGDIAGEWLVFALGIAIAGKALYADFVFDFAFAWTLGIVFQYFSIVPMRDVGPLKGIKAAIKADTFSIVAFQIGLFGGMYLYQEVVFPHPLSKMTATYWFMMQLSMIVGFFTSWPVNVWLLRKGLKEKM